MKHRAPHLAPLAAALLLVLGSCGGGGGGGDAEPPVEQIGVFTGFKDAGNLDWESNGGGDGGVGDGGADGDGGVGAGGDFGQFRGAVACVYLDNGAQLGCALTDNVKGMVTIRPGRDYKGGLRIELSGTPTATYYEEGRDTYVSFPADQIIRVWVPSVARNIGITPFTEAAYRLLTEGSAPESVGTMTPTKAQIRAANERVRLALNEHFPSALHVDDIARLPFIKSQSLPAGSMRTDPRGRYGLVNGAFSKQASFHNGDTATPTLDAVRQLAEDLLDGRIDGRNADAPAGLVASRTYDPNTLTGELSSALAEQASRFGAQEALDALPKVLNFGNVRYEGYLFDGSISKEGNAFSTVAGWVAGNERGLATGQQFDRLPGRRALALYANNGHGGGFYKADALGPRHKVFAIGDNVNGELGLGTRNSTRGQAVEVTALPAGMTHAVGGFAHTVVRLANGQVYAWGDNSFGQLGQGQGPDTLPNSLTPLRVNLPRRALAVAATNTASYALLDNGTVWSWGDNGGFGLLGNGARDGSVPTPAAVDGLSNIVLLSARDNDVVVVRNDNTVWHWGSFPADANALVPGDVSSPYGGGNLAPVQLSGLPAGVPVRKVLTEQGLFAALLANGHVYHWGVHFDLSADQVLRDLAARRIFGLPPVRDLMPGGFFGYGKRPFDRLTGMAVDYSGGMWKVRGRVAERFEPDNPAAQRRPPGAARPDCESCHTFLDFTIEQLRAQQPSTEGMPVCQPPAQIHTPGGNSLIHAETECLFCHNPSRANYPNLPQPFASSGLWRNCTKPTTLPPRTALDPPLITDSCALPVNHTFTPPGTVCATCHNSIIARPLQSLSPACAQPLSSELPTIPTAATLAGAFATPGGASIAAGSFTATRRYELRGTLSAGLSGGQSLEVMRNGSALGTAAVTGTNWTFTLSSDAPEGLMSHAARIVAGTGFGRTSNALAFTVDVTPPAALASVSGFVDEGLGPVASGGFASDTTPTVLGSISAALGGGEVLQVLRNSSVVGQATVSGTTWSYTEPSALAGATYNYQARAIDAAGNANTPSATATLTVVTSTLPTAGVTQATVSSPGGSPGKPVGFVVGSGGTIPDSTPTLTISLGAPLQSGYQVIVLRNGAQIGTLNTCASPCTFTDPGTTQGSHEYRTRTIAGAVQGPLSGIFSLVVDTVAPTQTVTSTQMRSNYSPISTVAGAVPANDQISNGGNTNDSAPVMRVTLSGPLGAGEFVSFRRGTTEVATLSAPNCGANCYESSVSSSVSIVTSVVDGTTMPASIGGTGFQTMGTVSFTARAEDAAGLEGAASGGYAVNVGYFLCHQNRANATFNALNPPPPGDPPFNHPVTISRAADDPMFPTRCISCHNVAAGHPSNIPPTSTPAGFFVAVPSSVPTYWCRRPS